MSKRNALLVLSCWLLVAAVSGALAGEQKAALLAVSKGTMPNDTNENPQLALEEKAELGGPALKVVFPAGSSFGETRPKVTNWTGYKALRFDAFNAGEEAASLTLTVKHKGTTSYPTRVDVPLMLKPGKSTVELGVADMANVDGSRPDLSLVKHWYIACDKAGTTVYFGDFWLMGEGAAAAPAPAAAPAAPAAGAGQPIRITGKVGDMPVDLTITGLSVVVAGAGVGAGPAAPAAAPGTPATPAAGAKAALLPISKGTLPGDTNNDPKLALVDDKELGVALKVTFTKESSFGETNPRIKDWTGFSALKVTATNPSAAPVPITLVVKHKGTKDFATRVDKDLVLAPGKNEISVPLVGLANNEGGAADLSLVRHWYIASDSEATVLFGDFTLEK